MTFLSLALFSLILEVCFALTLAERKFTDFIVQYSKEYSTSSERNLRFEIFQQNLALIEEHNAGSHSYLLGVNQFADLTVEEFASHLHFPQRNASAKVTSKIETPPCAAIDWEKEGAVLPVKNQLACGSSPYYGATGSVAGRIKIAGQPLYDLSIQEVVDCSHPEGNNGCEGGRMTFEFEYIMKKGGLCLENDYPYKGKDQQCPTDPLCPKRYANISGYKELAAKTKPFEAALCQGPVATAVNAFDNHFQLYKSGVLNSTSCNNYPDHGILMIGFGIDPQYGDYWRLQNSWTTDWGEEGYIRLCRNCNHNKGMCQVLSSGSYPIV